MTLLAKTRYQIYKLDIQLIERSAPQLRDYVRTLNDQAFKYGELNKIISRVNYKNSSEARVVLLLVFISP